MNSLKIHTIPANSTGLADTFLVYWTNNELRVRGVLKVQVTAEICDKPIAAELAALQHLLEVKGVLGDQLVGNAHTRLIVSSGAIRKLRRGQSDKAQLAPYASFLTTRFAGCPLVVDKNRDWFRGFEPSVTEVLRVDGPLRETLTVTGLGEVAVTRHVLSRLAGRFLPDTRPDHAAQQAWKTLKAAAADRCVREVRRSNAGVGRYRSGPDRPEGRYFLNPNQGLVLVVTDRPHEGKRLVTAYPANHQFRELPGAA